MKEPKRVNWYFAIQIVLLVTMLFPVVACSNIGGLREFNGIVVGKRDSNQILVVPNVEADLVQNLSEAALLEIAHRQKGVYFSVDREIFETVTVGSRVVVYYDPDDGEEVSVPPRRHSQRVEIVSD